MLGFLGDSDYGESACDAENAGSVPGSGRSPGEGNGYPLSSILAWRINGQRSLVDYSPWGWKEWDRTEELTLSLHSMHG